MLIQLQSRRISHHLPGAKSNIEHLPGELLITLVRTLVINPLPYFCLPQNGYQFLPLELNYGIFLCTNWNLRCNTLEFILGTTRVLLCNAHTHHYDSLFWAIYVFKYIYIIFRIADRFFQLCFIDATFGINMNKRQSNTRIHIYIYTCFVYM